MKPDDEARAFQTARELIAKHGNDVGEVLQAKIDELVASHDFKQLSVWFAIRNAVALTLGSDTKLH